MARLIDAISLERFFRENVTHLVYNSGNSCILVDHVLHTVRNAPAVDARPVVHGRWVKKAHYPYYCSVCEMIAPLDFEGESHYKSNYCPNCGADMRGADND